MEESVRTQLKTTVREHLERLRFRGRNEPRMWSEGDFTRLAQALEDKGKSVKASVIRQTWIWLINFILWAQLLSWRWEARDSLADYAGWVMLLAVGLGFVLTWMSRTALKHLADIERALALGGCWQ